MDSFYDQPRTGPLPRSVPICTEKIPSSVPEASMLFQNHGNVPQSNNVHDKLYNTWKIQHKLQSEQNFLPPFKSQKENAINKPQIQPSICRKQVRFESPQLITIPKKQIIKPSHPNTNNISNTLEKPFLLDSSNIKPTLQYNFRKVPSLDDSFNLSNFQAPHFTPAKPQLNKILQSKPFDKIYMANIPNRSLDLSIIEPPGLMKDIALPVDSQKTPESLKNNIFEHVKPPQKYINKNALVEKYLIDNANMFATKPIHIAESTNIEPKTCPNDEPTIKDLLKIIQQQNEQLISLQKQVTTLIQDRQDSHSQQIDNYSQKCIEPMNRLKNKQLDQNGLPKFAIDVMTSFEVSIRAPNKFVNRKFNKDLINHEPRIQEITDKQEFLVKNDKPVNNKNVDVSLTLNEPLVVQEECQSPDNSVHVDMQDYSSESEDDESSSLIGWTIYNNVMDQVNYLLKKPQATNKEEIPNSCDKVGTQTMKKVKEATMKHLKNIGVHFPKLNDEESLVTNSDTDVQYSPTEISFAVKQLLMKYLPDEHLAKITDNKMKMDNLRNNPSNFITRRPEFSMATLQYMEKYNLLDKSSKKGGAPHKARTNDAKLLDITALKQQPKLL